ncbi:Hypothetical protein PHPALM_9116 [Phytophthora palmivora]|uniref:Retrotransposon gag domain-containing protein n=1 Tax=Phytophthora palmivora TaxID=4796 RepID=A0A2P4Y852_9STRA|nr:Hypothetical protein PHPALM_9116 [Phytophthora palmivora]
MDGVSAPNIGQPATVTGEPSSSGTPLYPEWRPPSVTMHGINADLVPSQPMQYIINPTQTQLEGADEQTLKMEKKGLDLKDFRGRVGRLSLAFWLSQIHLGIRRSESKFGRHWETGDLYLEVSAKLQDEAAAWFHRISSTVHGEGETLENLTALLQTKYGNHLDATEVMNRIRERRQMPGEGLSDFSSALLELGGDKDIDDSWYVSSFLNGMDNQAMAQFVKAQHPSDLLSTTQLAIPDCGMYGEGTQVGNAKNFWRWGPNNDDPRGGSTTTDGGCHVHGIDSNTTTTVSYWTTDDAA